MKPPTWNPGLRIRVDGLRERDTTKRQKVHLAARLSPYDRDESIAQLVTRLPYNRDAIHADTQALRDKRIITTALSGKYARGIKIVDVDPRYDNRAGKFAHLPGPLVERVIDGKPRGATNALLLGLLFAKEQVHRGAIHVTENAARNDLDLSEKEYRIAIARLKRTGVIKKVGSADQTPIYVMPDLDVKPRPDDLMPSLTDRTTTFRSQPRRGLGNRPLGDYETALSGTTPREKIEDRPSTSSLRSEVLADELRSPVAEAPQSGLSRPVLAVVQSNATSVEALGERDVEGGPEPGSPSASSGLPLTEPADPPDEESVRRFADALGIRP